MRVRTLRKGKGSGLKLRSTSGPAAAPAAAAGKFATCVALHRAHHACSLGAGRVAAGRSECVCERERERERKDSRENDKTENKIHLQLHQTSPSQLFALLTSHASAWSTSNDVRFADFIAEAFVRTSLATKTAPFTGVVEHVLPARNCVRHLHERERERKKQQQHHLAWFSTWRIRAACAAAMNNARADLRVQQENGSVSAGDAVTEGASCKRTRGRGWT